MQPQGFVGRLADEFGIVLQRAILRMFAPPVLQMPDDMGHGMRRGLRRCHQKQSTFAPDVGILALVPILAMQCQQHQQIDGQCLAFDFACMKPLRQRETPVERWLQKFRDQRAASGNSLAHHIVMVACRPFDAHSRLQRFDECLEAMRALGRIDAIGPCHQRGDAMQEDAQQRRKVDAHEAIVAARLLQLGQHLLDDGCQRFGLVMLQ